VLLMNFLLRFVLRIVITIVMMVLGGQAGAVGPLDPSGLHGSRRPLWAGSSP
jgi:hypothetical protein